MSWTTLKTAIADVIKTNGTGAITGPILQNVLDSIVSVVGEDPTYLGEVTPDSVIVQPDGPKFCLATSAGVYQNLGAIRIYYPGLYVFHNDGVSWTHTQIYSNSSIKILAPTEGSLLLNSLVKNIYITGYNPDMTQGSDDFIKVDYIGVKHSVFRGKDLGFQITVLEGGSYVKASNYNSGTEVLGPNKLIKLTPQDGDLVTEGVSVYVELTSDFELPSASSIYRMSEIRLNNKAWDFNYNPKNRDDIDTTITLVKESIRKTNQLCIESTISEVGINPGQGGSNVNGFLTVQPGYTGKGCNTGVSLYQSDVSFNLLDSDEFIAEIKLISNTGAIPVGKFSVFTTVATNSTKYNNEHYKSEFIVESEDVIIMRIYFKLNDITTNPIIRVAAWVILNNATPFSTLFDIKAESGFYYFSTLISKGSGDTKILNSIIDTKLKGNLKEITVSSDLADSADFKGPNAIQEAIDSITDASVSNRYRIYVKAGLYKITNSSQFIGNPGYPAMICPKDHVDIIGQSKDDCIVWAELPYDDAQIDTAIGRNQHQTLYTWADDSLIANITLVAKNIRYTIHQDNGLEADKTRKYKDVDIVFIGDKGSIKCWGIGTHSGSETYIEGGKSICSVAQPFACHNSVVAKNISKFVFKNHKFISEGTNSSMLIQNSGTMVGDIMQIDGCDFGGSNTIDYIDWWIYSPGQNDHFNHAEWKIRGSSNKPFFFANTSNGYSLAVKSLSTGVNSIVRFDINSSAYPILIKNPREKYGPLSHPERSILNKYVLFDGGLGLSGYSIGCVSIREEDYIFGTTVSQDSMGKRLGDCSSVNKSLGITIDGNNYNVVFNKNYTTYTNAQIIAEINTVIGTVGLAYKHNIGMDYYPETDNITVGVNSSATTPILNGTIVTLDGGKVKPASSSDEEFGVAIDDIKPYTLLNGEISGKGRILQNNYISSSQADRIHIKITNPVEGERYSVDNGGLVQDPDGKYIIKNGKVLI